MTKIAASILASNLLDIKKDLDRVMLAGADWVHVDVMDGAFVPNISFGQGLTAAMRGQTDYFLDVHLMINNPARFIEEFAENGADMITVHAEATAHLHRAVQLIKKNGKMAGVAINPAACPDALTYVLNDVDMILVMTVNPGFGGQSFITQTLGKIKRIREMLRIEKLNKTLIEVDGGINAETARLVTAAGADVLVAGTALFGASDVAAAIRALKCDTLVKM